MIGLLEDFFLTAGHAYLFSTCIDGSDLVWPTIGQPSTDALTETEALGPTGADELLGGVRHVDLGGLAEGAPLATILEAVLKSTQEYVVVMYDVDNDCLTSGGRPCNTLYGVRNDVFLTETLKGALDDADMPNASRPADPPGGSGGIQ